MSTQSNGVDIGDGIIHHTRKQYEYQKSLLYAIQCVTNQSTHEILTFLTSELEDHLSKSGIDINKPAELQKRIGGYTSERRAHKYIYYPGTKLYIGLYAMYCKDRNVSYKRNIFSQSRRFTRDKSDYYSLLKFNFKLPSSAVKLNQDEFEDLLTEGLLLEQSEDIKEPDMRGTLTKEERAAKEEIQKKKNAEYRKKYNERIAAAKKEREERLKKRKKKVRKKKATRKKQYSL